MRSKRASSSFRLRSDDRSVGRSRGIPFLHSFATLLAVAAAMRIWLPPWFEPRERRGAWLWGWYHPLDVYVGVPVLLVAVWLSALWLVPRARRRAAGLRSGAVLGAVLGALYGFDLLWTFVVCGVGRPNYWLDLAHVSRRDNAPDPELGFVRRPYTRWTGRVRGSDRIVRYATDRWGFRNPADLERADLVLIGDSYTEAAQVPLEETFGQLLARTHGVTVANLGRGAYGPQQELVVLRRYGLALRPKVVIWQLFEGNDLSDAENYARWRDRSVRTVVPLRRRIVDNSFFRPWLDLTYRPRRVDRALLRCAAGRLVPLEIRYPFRPFQARERESGWVEIRRALAEGAELCRANGMRLVVFVVPVMADVCRRHLQIDDPTTRARCLPPEPPRRADLATFVRAWCAERKVEHVDVPAALAAAARREPCGLYIPVDEHLDTRGHAVVAEALAGALRGRR